MNVRYKAVLKKGPYIRALFLKAVSVICYTFFKAFLIC